MGSDIHDSFISSCSHNAQLLFCFVLFLKLEIELTSVLLGEITYKVRLQDKYLCVYSLGILFQPVVTFLTLKVSACL